MPRSVNPQTQANTDNTDGNKPQRNSTTITLPTTTTSSQNLRVSDYTRSAYSPLRNPPEAGTWADKNKETQQARRRDYFTLGGHFGFGRNWDFESPPSPSAKSSFRLPDPEDISDNNSVASSGSLNALEVDGVMRGIGFDSLDLTPAKSSDLFSEELAAPYNTPNTPILTSYNGIPLNNSSRESKGQLKSNIEGSRRISEAKYVGIASVRRAINFDTRSAFNLTPAGSSFKLPDPPPPDMLPNPPSPSPDSFYSKLDLKNFDLLSSNQKNATPKESSPTGTESSVNYSNKRSSSKNKSWLSPLDQTRGVTDITNASSESSIQDPIGHPTEFSDRIGRVMNLRISERKIKEQTDERWIGYFYNDPDFVEAFQKQKEERFASESPRKGDSSRDANQAEKNPNNRMIINGERWKMGGDSDSSSSKQGTPIYSPNRTVVTLNESGLHNSAIILSSTTGFNEEGIFKELKESPVKLISTPGKKNNNPLSTKKSSSASGDRDSLMLTPAINNNKMHELTIGRWTRTVIEENVRWRENTRTGYGDGTPISDTSYRSLRDLPEYPTDNIGSRNLFSNEEELGGSLSKRPTQPPPQSNPVQSDFIQASLKPHKRDTRTTSRGASPGTRMNLFADDQDSKQQRDLQPVAQSSDIKSAQTNFKQTSLKPHNNRTRLTASFPVVNIKGDISLSSIMQSTPLIQAPPTSLPNSVDSPIPQSSQKRSPDYSKTKNRYSPYKREDKSASQEKKPSGPRNDYRVVSREMPDITPVELSPKKLINSNGQNLSSKDINLNDPSPHSLSSDSIDLNKVNLGNLGQESPSSKSTRNRQSRQDRVSSAGDDIKKVSPTARRLEFDSEAGGERRHTSLSEVGLDKDTKKDKTSKPNNKETEITPHEPRIPASSLKVKPLEVNKPESPQLPESKNARIYDYGRTAGTNQIVFSIRKSDEPIFYNICKSTFEELFDRLTSCLKADPPSQINLKNYSNRVEEGFSRALAREYRIKASVFCAENYEYENLTLNLFNKLMQKESSIDMKKVDGLSLKIINLWGKKNLNNYDFRQDLASVLIEALALRNKHRDNPNSEKFNTLMSAINNLGTETLNKSQSNEVESMAKYATILEKDDHEEIIKGTSELFKGQLAIILERAGGINLSKDIKFEELIRREVREILKNPAGIPEKPFSNIQIQQKEFKNRQ